MLSRKIFLIIFLISIALAALLVITGISNLLGNNLEEYTFGFGFIIALTGLCLFLASFALGKPRKSWLGITSISLTGLTCLFVTTMMLMDKYSLYGTPFYDIFQVVLKIMGFCVSFSISLAIAVFMLSFDLTSIAFWSRRFSLTFLTLTNITLLIVMGVDNQHGSYEELFLRLFAIFIVISVLGSLTTLCLLRFYSLKPKPLTEYTPSIYITCPRCLTPQEILVGDSSCRQCKLKIKIEIEDPTCPQCGYFLRGLTHPICPECGKVLADSLIANTLSTVSQSHQPNNPV